MGNEFVKRGMVAQVSIHEPEADNGQRNPHAHLLLTMREVNDRTDSAKKTANGTAAGWRRAYRTAERLKAGAR